MKQPRFFFTAAVLCVTLLASVLFCGCQPQLSSSSDPSSLSSDNSSVSSVPTSSSFPVSSSSVPETSSVPTSSATSDTFTFNLYDITVPYTGYTYRIYNGSVPVDQIQWTSENPTIVQFENGVITAVSGGTAWVHAEYNGTKLSCIVRCRISSASSQVPASSVPASSAPTSSTPAASPIQPGISTGTLEQLRSTHIYKAVKKLNSAADFTNPDAYGETAYNQDWFSADGFEETANGQPDYAEMKEQGICCAGFVNYYLFNYLPNVAGVNPGLTWKTHPNNSNVDIHAAQIRANSTSYTMNNSSWTKTYSTPLQSGKDYSYIAQDYANGKLKYRIGDILTLSSSNSNYYHVAVYAGYYDGQHWIAHATDTPKGVGVTLTPFNGYSLPRKNFFIYVTEIFTP